MSCHILVVVSERESGPNNVDLDQANVRHYAAGAQLLLYSHRHLVGADTTN